MPRILRPKGFGDFTRQAMARYATERLAEKYNSKRISRATVNTELRQFKAALREAAKRKYIAACPPIDPLREDTKVPTYCSPEHYAMLYDACDARVADDR